MYRYARLLLATTMLSLSPLALHQACAAGPDMGIAAVVGSDAISSYDVDNRVRFIIATAHLSNTPDVVEKIRPQVIRTLIDEKLKLQEAQKNDIKVSDADVAQAIEAIGEQRAMPKDAIYQLLDSNHIPHETLTQQIRAQLAWNQLLTKKIRPQVRVSDEEIAVANHRIAPPPKHVSTSGGVVQEIKIAVITLPVDKPSHLQEIKKLADKLVKEVRGGANFEEVSRQFSSGTASSEGKVEAFWVRPSQLDPNIANVLSTATPNSVTDPLRSNEGFTIIKVYDVHSTSPKEALSADEPEDNKPKIDVVIKSILIKLKQDANAKEADMMLQVGEDVTKHPGACEDKSVANIDNLKDFDIEVNFIRQPLDELPPAIRVIASNLKTGDISTPFASNEGIRLYMLCSRKEAQGKLMDHDEVYHMLIQQKMELESQKYIRNLRREVFIDIRG